MGRTQSVGRTLEAPSLKAVEEEYGGHSFALSAIIRGRT